MLELYHHNISVCAQKVRLALHEKGIDWEGHHIDLMKGEQTSPEYLAINPRGVTPTLVHDGNPVIESTIILEYLEDAFPELPLRPASALSRARMRVWAKIPDDGLHAACGAISYAAAGSRNKSPRFMVARRSRRSSRSCPIGHERPDRKSCWRSG